MNFVYPQKRLYEILEINPPGDNKSKWVNLGIATLILLNSAVLLGEYLEPFQAFRLYLKWFRWFSLGVFVLEYIPAAVELYQCQPL